MEKRQNTSFEVSNFFDWIAFRRYLMVYLGLMLFLAIFLLPTVITLIHYSYCFRFQLEIAKERFDTDFRNGCSQDQYDFGTKKS